MLIAGQLERLCDLLFEMGLEYGPSQPVSLRLDSELNGTKDTISSYRRVPQHVQKLGWYVNKIQIVVRPKYTDTIYGDVGVSYAILCPRFLLVRDFTKVEAIKSIAVTNLLCCVAGTQTLLG